VITSVDGRSIKDGDDLVTDIASRRPGSTVRLGFVRDDKQMDASVTIADRDLLFSGKENAQAAPNSEENGDVGETKLGIVVHEISPATAEKLHAKGVVIQSVRSGSFADLLQPSLQPGLVILRVNKQPTGTKGQFDAVVGKLKSGDDVVFEVVDPRRPSDGINYVGGTLQ
ncbi:MAG: PDZ domain-containing protein, partial [Terracidiphilus sp.]